MICAVHNDIGVYYTASSPTETWAAIDRGEVIRCWWYSDYGKKFEEEFRFNAESVKMIRTESDASPLEEM